MGGIGRMSRKDYRVVKGEGNFLFFILYDDSVLCIPKYFEHSLKRCFKKNGRVQTYILQYRSIYVHYVNIT